MGAGGSQLKEALGLLPRGSESLEPDPEQLCKILTLCLVQEASFQQIAAIREKEGPSLFHFPLLSHPILCILFGCAYLHNLSHKS